MSIRKVIMDGFDPQQAFCWNDDCHNPVLAEKFEGFSEETFDVDEDGEVIAEIVLLVCYDCATINT